MAIHAIVLEEGNEDAEVAQRIEENYPQNYSINDKCFIVRTDDVSSKVAAKVGISGDEDAGSAVGVVLRLNGAHSGYASSSLWEWLADENAR